MGYSTIFDGEVRIDPPLNEDEILYINRFSETRRMRREKGPYYVDGGGLWGQNKEAYILDYNHPPEGQPGLWCGWRIAPDGGSIVWDGTEKFYNSPEWMKYLIDHFLKPNAIALEDNCMAAILQANHILNGTIHAQGEDPDDTYDIEVIDNIVYIVPYAKVRGVAMEV